MKENNEMQENQYIFGNADNSYENKASSGLDQDTFGAETNVEQEQKTTVYTPGWNEDVYTTMGQNDYYNQNTFSKPEKKKGKALEICALIFGIISLCGCCYGVFGLVGLVLSIVALATGRKSGLSIAGLVLSVLGIVAALMWCVFSFSPAGQQWREEIVKAFREGFEAGYNSTYDYDSENIDEVSEEQEETNINADSTESLVSSEQVMGIVVINGKEITIPCKVSEARCDFELSTYSEDDLEAGLEAYDSDIIHLLSDGSETGIRLMVTNPQNTDIADIDDAYVTGVWLNDYMNDDVDVKFYKNITVGMKEEDLINVISSENYEKDENSDYYTIKSSEYEQFYMTIYVEDGEVSEVDIDYYGDCE